MTMSAPVVMVRRQLRQLKVPRLPLRHTKQGTCRKRLQVKLPQAAALSGLRLHSILALPILNGSETCQSYAFHSVAQGSAMLACFLPHAHMGAH